MKLLGFEITKQTLPSEQPLKDDLPQKKNRRAYSHAEACFIHHHPQEQDSIGKLLLRWFSWLS